MLRIYGQIDIYAANANMKTAQSKHNQRIILCKSNPQQKHLSHVYRIYIYVYGVVNNPSAYIRVLAYK